MRDEEKSRSFLRGAHLLGLGLATAVVLGGCSHVSGEDLDTELAELQESLRQEMEAGDEEVRTETNQRFAELERRLDGLESDLRTLADDFDATVERLETAIRFHTPVFFAFDDATVREEDREVLERFADVMNAYYPGALITVEGFTDPAGPEEYNRRLGERRAEAVRSYLIEQEMGADRIRTVSYGEAQDRQVVPGAAGPGEKGLQNRRVVMVIDYPSEAEAATTMTEDNGDDEAGGGTGDTGGGSTDRG